MGSAKKTKERFDIVLISGMSRESRHWGKLPEALAKLPITHNVFPIDLPGCGKFWRKRGALSVREMLKHVQGEYKHSPKEKARRKIVIGLSLGGMVAFDWVCQQPWEFGGYVLINSSFGNLSSPFSRIRFTGFLRLLRGLAEKTPLASERAILEVGSQKYGTSRGILDRYIKIQKTHPVSLETVACQVLAAATFYPQPRHGLPQNGLVLASRRDRLVNYRCSQRIAHHYGLELCIHPAAGHDLPLDDPEWVLDRIRGMM